ncbi:MAG: head GIN domain-containing protein [Bacteroidota bacterium]|uniref:head GIN domain-containing protein n=1 Tax=Nonlabens tegetincola TaxID=323273 RepID=UPI000A20752A|nr:head GIN domain-containing protein [Nonlabens tegetincola]ARN72204.1 chaperonin [Nonlabens tegetincola]MEE2801378.1 head GIN domain-containing protein [Bacteroidota bacterium]
MKFIVSSLIVLFSVIIVAQNPIEEDMGNFDTIKTFDLVKVNLVKSDVNKLVITGEDAQDVEFVLKNKTLKIRMKTERIFDGQNTFIHVYYKDLQTIDGNEGSVIVVNELMTQNNLEIKVQEGARVEAGVAIEHLDIRAVTGGIVSLTGAAKNQNIVVNTGGIVENAGLKTDDSRVKIQAGGEVEVYASNYVKIRINAGGDVMVYGNPNNINKKTVFGGRIEFVE